MRGEDLRQGAMFSYISLEERIPSRRRSHRSADQPMTRRSGPGEGGYFSSLLEPFRGASRITWNLFGLAASFGLPIYFVPSYPEVLAAIS